MNKKAVAMLGLLCFLGLWMLVGCSKKESSEEQPAASPAAAQPAATPIDPATVASVSGTVKFDGAAPKAAKIDMSQDPACKGGNESENIVVSGGNLANVFVYVKDGLGNRTFALPRALSTLDQAGLQVSSSRSRRNGGPERRYQDDDRPRTTFIPRPRTTASGTSRSRPAPRPSRRTSREEIMLPVKCNQHPWMKMYINVVKNPFFAVTDTAASTKSRASRPGDYTIAFVQEKLGEKDQQVTLAAKDSKTVDASFKQ